MLYKRREFVAGMAFGSGALLAGCATTGENSGPLPAVAFESLVRQIKHDVGSYIVQHQDDAVSLAGTNCAGQVGFAIQKVKMTVTAQLDRGGEFSTGLSVPIGLVTLGPSGSRSRLVSNTITTSLTIWPIIASADAEFEDETMAVERLIAVPAPAPEFEGTPIADALNKLQRDLIATSDTPPCFNFGQGDQKDNVVKWAFSVTRKEKVGGKLSLAIFSVGAESSTSQIFANTIEATFIAAGEGFG